MDTTAALLTNALPEDVSGWWVSEKYDGVRAIWTGTSLLTRHGKPIKVPTWFTAGLPAGIRLDGELWIGSGTFDKLQSTLQTNGSNWDGVKYMIFDLAGAGTFEERYTKLRLLSMPPHCCCVTHEKLSDHDDLMKREARIVNILGGEGCVIRRPGCLYRPGRSGDVIKVKRITKDVDRWQG